MIMKKYDREQEKEHCLECGNELSYGRAGKKFCSDKCKNSYHNRREYASRNLKAKVNAAIERNYRILSRVMSIGMKSVSLQELALMGFDRDYMTSYRKSGRFGQCSCYNITYRITPTRIYEIKKPEPLSGSGKILSGKVMRRDSQPQD